MSHEWLLDIDTTEYQQALKTLDMSGMFTQDEVRTTYRRIVAASKCHPDQGGDGVRFKQLTEARDLLLAGFNKSGGVKFSTFGAGVKQGTMRGKGTNAPRIRALDDVLFQLRSLNVEHEPTLDKCIGAVVALRRGCS